MTLSGLIFDVDGTLAETEELHRQAFNEVFAAHGLDWNWGSACYRDLLKVTGGKERMLHFAKRDRPGELAALEAALGRLHAAKNARYAELVAAGALQLRPGIRRLIESCAAQGLPMAIATTTSRDNLDALLTATLGPDGARLFETLVTGEDVSRKKPDPEAYTLALQRLNLPAIECIAFEDSLNGLVAARSAGLHTVVTPSFYTDHERFDGALAVLSDLGESDRPYRHVAGRGSADALVDLESLARWISTP